MAYILSYTKPGVGLYNYISDYSMLETPYNCDKGVHDVVYIEEPCPL